MWVTLQSSHHKASRVYQHDAQKPPSIPSDKKRNPIKVLSPSTDEHSDGTKTLLLYLRLLSSIIKYELYVHDSKHEVYDSALQNRIQITLRLYLVIHRSSTNEALVLLALWFWGQLNKGKFSPDTKRLIRTTRSSKPSSDLISVHSYSWKGGLDSCATPQTTNTNQEANGIIGSLDWTE